MAPDTGQAEFQAQQQQMQQFRFAPQNEAVAREPQRSYVFVDEHNRHKRLKVMRACEGFRRRKIKCDAATTNTWPCSACVRLKLQCVPPSLSQDGLDTSGGSSYAAAPYQYEASPMNAEGYQHQLDLGPPSVGQSRHVPTTYTQSNLYTGDPNMYQGPDFQHISSSYSPDHGVPYPGMHTPVSAVDQGFSGIPQDPFAYMRPPIVQHSHPGTPDVPEEAYAPEDVAEMLGELSVSDVGTAKYLDRKNKEQNFEEPVLEDAFDFKDTLPPTPSGSDARIRIPPELMPDNDTIMHYFALYFANVHPYVPVLNKVSFYNQWREDRESISPLILEAIFAIAGRLADEPAQGHQWLALASKHVDAFMDKPRLSTLQAMLIVLKARESAPKRGYYFRSWMTVVACVQMAKDLGLDEHYEDHKAGQSCGVSLADCITKTRIWQTLFICELMVGSPQGRTDLSVDPDSVDMRIQKHFPGTDEAEYSVTRNFTYFVRVVGNVRKMLDAYTRMKKKKDWAIDPQIKQLNPGFESWLHDLPADLQLNYMPDGSPPHLPTHFLGNLHSYYHLSIIMTHRPQLSFMHPSDPSGVWKKHMLMCYSSAKYLCRLQEGLVIAYGLTGLLCMQRGINFTIYCVLTCTVLHLVALTSPDAELNSDAREYFTRHMRILERCSSSWPQPDMQEKIDALREAFSANIKKPFVLKPTFPYGSPRGQIGSPPRTNSGSQVSVGMSQSQASPYHSHPVSPPISAGATDQNPFPLPTHGGMSTQNFPQQSGPGNMHMVDGGGWNPARIFDQWASTFGTTSPSSTASSQTTPLSTTPHTGTADMMAAPSTSTSSFDSKATLEANMQQPQHPGMPMQQQMSHPQQTYFAPVPPPPQPARSSFISPSMWQESVARVYEGGMKRSWNDYSNMGGHGE